MVDPISKFFVFQRVATFMGIACEFTVFTSTLAPLSTMEWTTATDIGMLASNRLLATKGR